MLSNLSPANIIMLNFALMLSWHLVILLISVSLNTSFFDPCKPFYAPQKWEKNGIFYIKKLKIKRWKDFLPQYVAKDGFSKRHLDFDGKIMNEKYINAFIIETCRAEWNHVMCCMYFVISFFVNSFCYALAFSIVPVIVNIPFIVIQRYNRIRLEKLSQKYARSKLRKAPGVSFY